MKRRIFRNGQVGQSIVILAIGFIALVAFVGIVTDVSLLFVRYSTLRRAVDAAAIAAAGQMRRIPDTTDNGIAEDQASSIANMNLAARTFIEYYGLSPRNVLVETCHAQNIYRDSQGRPMDNATPRNYLYLYNSSGVRIGPNTAADAQVRERYEQLCTDDELKLVRVTAQIDSPTAFLSILGYPTVTLTETAISQTAVIDVVMIIDVSESMLNETGYDDWERIGQGVRYLPPTISPYDYAAWGNLVASTQNALNVAYASRIEVFRPTAASLDDVEPRVECRVRAWPMSAYAAAGIPPANSPTNPSSPLRQEYENYLTGTGRSMSYFSPPAPTPDPLPNPYTPPPPVSQRYWGFVPMYNSFGCCNDPDGNWRFDDAVCQPFRDARDAAENFLNRLDFIRGDRIAFVTFDRRAHIVDPDGTGIQTPMIETQYNLTTGDPNTSRRGAYETLRDVIGVRAEPSFYADGEPGTPSDDDGYWDGFNDGGRNTTWSEYMGNTGIRIGEFFDQPIFMQCPFDMASMEPNYSLVDFYPDSTPRTASTTLMNDVVNGGVPGLPSWFSSVGDPTRPRDPRFYNYDAIASCAGTNIGGALRSASNVLFTNARREGAVWIMVFLSDGAAGASNPVTRQQSTAILNRTGPSLSVAARPYNTVGGNYVALPGEYGGFGLCPQGTQSNPGRWVLTLSFPTCSDTRPETRHFCGNTPANPDLRPIDVTPGCDINFYDVDDYARDWADWIGLANLPGVASGSGGRVGDQQLPTIFTIGFGLAFELPAATSGCSSADDCLRRGNIADTLGEELLRYIADVGDNFRIDDDYQQYILGPRIPNRVDVAQPDWGVRGPCELPALFAAQRGTYMPVSPRQSCGNYFNAVNGDALENVFNQIAQRMFTRLSQ